MKIRFVNHIFWVLLLLRKGHTAYLQTSTQNKSADASRSFYDESCCQETGYSAKDMLWLDPTGAIIGPGTDSNVYTEEQDDCLLLFIASPNKKLTGPYQCIIEYDGTRYIKTLNLDVYDPLYFFNTESKQYLVRGSDDVIYCQAKGASTPVIRWYKGKSGSYEIYNDRTKYQFVPEGLIVRNVVDEDAGVYICSASVLLTAEENETDIEVQIYSKPTITQLVALPETTATEGYSLIIECTTEALPAPGYIWTKVSNTEPSNQDMNVTWQQVGNTIRFDEIQAEDAGIYECLAMNYVGNDSRTIEIKVLVPPEITGFNNRTAVEGAEILIYCNVTGNPEPDVTITFNGRSLDEEMSTVYEELVDNYSFFKVTRDHEGFYICNATNKVDFVSEVMYLTVLHKPYFTKPNHILWAWNGEKVELNCNNVANPPSSIAWRYTKSAIGNVDEKYINDVLNSGMENISYNFNKEFEPYGIYQCKASNYLGEVEKSIEVKKGFIPSAVQNVSTLEVTTTTATFAIDSPVYYEGPPVLGFKAEYDRAERYNVTHIHPNRTWAILSPFKLEKLKANSTYFIRFAAINSVGTGPWSQYIVFKTPEKSVPEAPIWEEDSLQFMPSNVLKWREPEDNGETIDHYILLYCSEDPELSNISCKERRIVGATEELLDDLHYNQTYNFQLKAHNAMGYSSPTNISLRVPAEELVTGAPLLSGAAIIGISVVIVIVCLLLVDLLFLLWKRQGIIARCCYKKSKTKPNTLNSRDKKGLLKDNAGENTDDTSRRPNNGHREYEYNKTTGIITGKHSSV